MRDAVSLSMALFEQGGGLLKLAKQSPVDEKTNIWYLTTILVSPLLLTHSSAEFFLRSRRVGLRQVSRCMHGVRPLCSGFTLTELLVVIVIMAVLMALLLGVVGRIQAKGKESKCMSNVRSITTAYQMYVGENDGRYPATGNYSNTGGTWSDFWTETLLKRGYLSIPSQSLYFTNRSKHPKEGLLWCPCETSHHGIADYGPSDNVVPHTKAVVPVARIAFPSKTVLISESRAAVANGFGGSWWLKAADFISSPDGPASGSPLPSRHEGRVNMGFCDGHVEQLNEQFIRDNRATFFSGPHDRNSLP